MRERVLMRPTRKGLFIRDPITKQILKEEGEMKPKSTYWLRRIKDGDVEIVVHVEAPAKKIKQIEKEKGE